MREQLVQYVNLLFAGAAGAEDIRQEILQNTLDRYDDLVSHGKTPEAAYRLAISGIGDINEILNGVPEPKNNTQSSFSSDSHAPEEPEPIVTKILRAAAIALYILCPIPLFILSEIDMATVGLCGTLGIVAVATVLLLLGRQKDSETQEQQPVARESTSPQNELKKSIGSIITVVGLIVYFVLSFSTGAWYITWLIFPIMSAVRGLINAIVDLKEANKHET